MANSLETLIPVYASDKEQLDTFKKLCDEENKRIKQMMLGENITEKEAGGYIAKYTVQHRESMNEIKLLSILKECGVASGIVKTKEYVDMDALEDALYQNKISKDIVEKIAKCRETKEVPTLTVKKIKKKEDK